MINKITEAAKHTYPNVLFESKLSSPIDVSNIAEGTRAYVIVNGLDDFIFFVFFVFYLLDAIFSEKLQK
ncbi:MAG: hypothetical protein ACK5KL_11380 [Dysgonomonas sp.]|jgi:hypothetical protein